MTFIPIGPGLAVRHVEVLAVFAVFILPVITAGLTRVFRACPAFGHDPEIVIRELEIIFRQNTVALKLCLARQILVFLKHLRRIAARPVIDTAAIILAATTVVARRTTTASATTALLTIIKQVI
jgi:hypothetical protein